MDSLLRGIEIPCGLEAVWMWMKRFSWDISVGGIIAEESGVDFVGGGVGVEGGGEGVFDEGVGGESGLGEEGPRKNLTRVT
jgi:hypothetical protein